MRRYLWIIWIAGAVPILLVPFFWVRSHWWMDTASRSGDGGVLTVQTAGGLRVGWERDSYGYLWWAPTELFYVFEMPEWRLSMGDEQEEEQRRWFGSGAFAGADFTWSGGGTAWTLTAPWWALAIMAGVWAWLMWRLGRWVKKRQAKVLTRIDPRWRLIQPLAGQAPAGK